MDLEVDDNPDKERFEIVADGELAGFVQYHLRGDEIALTHTQTDDRFRGQGIASHLVQLSLNAVRERHLAVSLLPVRQELDQRAPRVRQPGPARPAPAVRPVRSGPVSIHPRLIAARMSFRAGLRYTGENRRRPIRDKEARIWTTSQNWC